MNPERIAEIRALVDAATPGPWGWGGNDGTRHHSRTDGTRPGPKHIVLWAVRPMRDTVMAFRRLGMREAQPEFVRDGLLVPAMEFVRREVEYRGDIVGLDHPDATFIAESRSLVPELLEALRVSQERVRNLETALQRFNRDNVRSAFLRSCGWDGTDPQAAAAADRFLDALDAASSQGTPE